MMIMMLESPAVQPVSFGTTRSNLKPARDILCTLRARAYNRNSERLLLADFYWENIARRAVARVANDGAVASSRTMAGILFFYVRPTRAPGGKVTAGLRYRARHHVPLFFIDSIRNPLRYLIKRCARNVVTTIRDPTCPRALQRITVSATPYFTGWSPLSRSTATSRSYTIVPNRDDEDAKWEWIRAISRRAHESSVALFREGEHSAENRCLANSIQRSSNISGSPDEI